MRPPKVKPRVLLPILGFVLASSLSAQSITLVGAPINGHGPEELAGVSVALSANGERMALGALNIYWDGSHIGHVRVYREFFGIWYQVGADIDGEFTADLTGVSVSLSADGTRLALGAPQNYGIGQSAGHVRVFSESGGIWTQVGADIDGEAPGDLCGRSVSLSANGQRVAIGAAENDGTAQNAGHVRVYEDLGGVWTQVGTDIDGEAAEDGSGHAVALSADGSRLAIGAQLNDGSASDAGHVRIFSESNGAWTQVGSDIDGEAAGDWSGRALSLSANGSRVAIGAMYNDGTGPDAGHVRVYDEVGGVWTQVGADIDGEADGDQSGSSVSLSADGLRLVVGGTQNDGGGSASGHMRVYIESGGVWTQVGTDIDGATTLDNAGFSVSISADGARVAMGEPIYEGFASMVGRARVYALPMSVDIPENTDQDAFQVMPIPATQVLHVELERSADLHLFNLAGRCVYSQRLLAGPARVDVSWLARGAYVAELRALEGGPGHRAKLLLE